MFTYLDCCWNYDYFFAFLTFSACCVGTDIASSSDFNGTNMTDVNSGKFFRCFICWLLQVPLLSVCKKALYGQKPGKNADF